MLHRTRVVRITPPSGQELDDQIIVNRLRRRKTGQVFSLKAITSSRMQGFVAAGGIILGAAVFLGPWLWEELQEMIGNKFVPLPPSHMPRTSPEWWENEWRKMNPLWRSGESTQDFFVRPYTFVKQQTGRDLSSAADFTRTAPSLASSSSAAGTATTPNSFLRRLTHVFHRSTPPAAPALLPDPPQMLVPLCGDSPIIRTAAMHGFEVDAVDSSQTAIQTAVRRTEEGLPRELYPRVHLHWKNFFAPELWEGPLKGKKYDVIYERQGMTSLNREERPDYAFLMKRALKEDGVIYVEGIFRTGRVRGNKLQGPPYSLSKRELEQLFPRSEGYYVRCEEKTDAMQQLSRENRVLQRVPKELYVTPFSCVVFGEAAVNLQTRTEPLQHPDAPVLTPTEEDFAW
ncbi:Thiopurine S-methyltransferase (TPMT) [Novymonas esmeraldas]|uniref:Thiopurine S-methyltransferase (TPMT) n=1 Tax=Novymonas esmeraldas TaxID=1808958 RepID=A0AAW0EWI2_9TRYP